MFLQRLDLTRKTDRAVATRIFLETPAYEVLSLHRLPTVDSGDQLVDRFPQACPAEERLNFVARVREEPVALVQVARHYSSTNSAMLMLLLVSRSHQRHHFGCELMERLSKQARQWPGVTMWELSVLDNNMAGIAFWRHCGFRTVASGQADSPVFSSGLLRMQRPIKGRPACQTGRVQEDDSALLASRLLARLP